MLDRYFAAIRWREFRFFLASLIIVLVNILTLPTAQAEGSRSLYPADYNVNGARANLDLVSSSSTNTPYRYINVVRRNTFLYVYAQAGEYILLGSRNIGNAGDVFVYNPEDFGPKGDEKYNMTTPGSPDFKCTTGSTSANDQLGGIHYSGSGKGRITTRAQELAGPKSADGTTGGTDTFTPCAYQVLSTGIYGVQFTPASSGSIPNGAINPPAFSSTSVAAWDVTVRSSATSTTDINGRVFTYAWTGFSTSFGKLYSSLYYVTKDGYRYRQTQQGFNPAGFVAYANASGFLDNGQPLYKDLRGSDGLVSLIMPSAARATLSGQAAQYPIFFSDITAADTQIELERVIAALGIPATPLQPSVTDNASFTGNQSGNTTTVGAGGIFSFTATNASSYQIVISQDGSNFDPDNMSNRVLTGSASTGSYSVYWDGKDNSGSNFPVGNDYQFKVTIRNGEVHFPIIDDEGNSNGGPTIQKLNGDGSAIVYYDDRGYVTSNGVAVGILNSYLCTNGSSTIQVPPTPDHSLVGLDST